MKQNTQKAVACRRALSCNLNIQQCSSYVSWTECIICSAAHNKHACARRAGSSTMSVFSVCTVPGLEQEEEEEERSVGSGMEGSLDADETTGKMRGMRAD